MNSGTFTEGVEKARAGMYFLFKSAAQNRLAAGNSGRVALPVSLSWGQAKSFIEITDEGDFQKKLGVDLDHASVLLIREAKKKSQTVLVYRLNEGTKATGQLAVAGTGTTAVTATALHGGVIGNTIKVVVQVNVLDSTKFDVSTFAGTQLVDKQTVTTAAELKANEWAIFAGTADLVATAGVTLTGGTDGTVTNLEYTDFLTAAENAQFDTIGLPVTANDELKATFVSFIRRLREEHGRKVRAVLSNYASDYEGVTNVTNGAVLATGETLTPAQTVAWVAGASAGATMYQSLTFVEYEGAVDVSPRFDNDETIIGLKNGDFMLTYDPADRTVSVEKDINSLVTLSATKDKRFQKNKIIRILDGIQNDLIREVKALIKAKKDAGSDIPANGDGMQIIHTAATLYMNTLQEGGALQNFDSSTDIQITLNTDADGFFINIGAQPVDAAEKFYFGVTVR
ncbi:phage tail sheath family protein [Domibacillus iocasae]|uniref:Phage tail sheath protein n=1 Tax=Domibacillus iocasae TaxID=1714016 RepID=A0A1E7DRW0_9BACI|nr:phage tail sheath family protein [Domibacillus iocasae]OES45810.1 phage tail sheath protein [Domibacillus iocasae]